MQTYRTGITKHFFAILCITDAEGKLLAEFSYGARGRARNPETWEYLNESEGVTWSHTLTIITIDGCGRYVPVGYDGNNLYIYPREGSIMTRGKVYFHAHTHFNYPGSIPGPSGEVNNALWSYGDRFFIFKLGIRAKIYDIQGKIWYY